MTWALSLFTIIAVSPTAHGEQLAVAKPESFSVTPALRPYVEFWKTIFSKYGEDQSVFHYRQHPGVVYSVLDFSHLKVGVTEKEYRRKRAQEIDDETDRITRSLTYLSTSSSPRDAFERRISRLFETYRTGRLVNYRDALGEGEIRTQTGIRERFGEGIKRSTRYLHAIEQIFRDYGLPVELSRVPLVESSFDYTAYSSVGAAGIWQFMRKTGKKYMRIDPYIDERKDPIAATRAAAKYFVHAYNVLGAWPLAVTSYNHGVNGILRASRAVGSQNIERVIAEYDGESFGFASQNFYTEFLAAYDVEREAARYFPALSRDEPWYFDEVRLGKSVGIKQLAAYAKQPIDEIQRLNPHLLKPISSGRVPIPSGTGIKVPLGSGAKVVGGIGGGTVLTESFHNRGRVTFAGAAAVKSVSEPKKERAEDSRKSRRTYTVKSGDSLSTIAKRNNLSLSDLKRLNPGAERLIKPGQKLYVE